MKATLEKLRTRKAAIEEIMSGEEVSRDPERMKLLGKEHADLSGLVGRIEELVKLRDQLDGAVSIIDESEDEELLALAREEVADLEPRIETLEEEVNDILNPADPLDNRGVVLEIRAGTGGEEAALFAAQLFRMYTRYGEERGWKTEILSINETGLGGCKEIIGSISGTNVFKRLKFESGTHRVQRVPVTESGGRIHTSAVTVAVLAEADKVDVEIKSEDLRIDTYRASSAGGQHVNKTDSAVRITHLPTGIVVQSQDQRSQHQNKEKAMMLLRTHIMDHREQEQKDAIAKERKSQVGTGDRSQRIRTYNFPQGRITDHRIGLTVHRLEYVLEGDMDEVIDALLDHEKRERTKERVG